MTNAELEQAVALLDWDRMDRLNRLDRLSLQLEKRLHALGNAVQTFVETADSCDGQVFSSCDVDKRESVAFPEALITRSARLSRSTFRLGAIKIPIRRSKLQGTG